MSIPVPSTQSLARQPPSCPVRNRVDSPRQKVCLWKMACAMGAVRLHASSRRSGALNTASAEPHRADNRAAMPDLMVSASQEREASSSIAPPYVYRNHVVQFRHTAGLPWFRGPAILDWLLGFSLSLRYWFATWLGA
jgi:hypothetical protein